MLIFLAVSAAIQVRQPKNQIFPLLPAIAISIVVLWAIIQTIAMPLWLDSNPLLASLPATLKLAHDGRIAIDVERAWTGIMRILAYVGVFWAASQLCTDRAFANRMCWTIIAAGIVVTTYGFVMQVSVRSCIVLTVIKRPLEGGDPCSFSGTFVNSGNYATYAGLVSLICVAQLHALIFRPDPPANRRTRLLQILTRLSGKGGIYLCALIVLQGGLLFSASRAGIAAFVIAAGIMIALLSASQRHGRASTLASFSMILIFMVIMLIIGGEGVIKRSFGLLIEGDRDRVSLFGLSLQAISLRPWTGWGVGSFEVIYSIFQTPALVPQYDKAHNTYLENAMDLGIPASILLEVAIFLVAVRCFRGMRSRTHHAHYPAIGFGCTVLVGLQAFVDFGVQIPAVAGLYAALLGMSWAQSWSSRQVEYSPSTT